VSEPKSKSFEISKHVVFEAYRRVKANKGAAGVDDESIAVFEVDLKGNLYKLWNRMSSGSYFPPPVKMVEIPKPGGKGGHQSPRGADRRGPRRADGGGHVPGAEGGADVPPGLLRVPATPLGVGRGGGVPAALLENRLGDRS
jgi:hypothetical protein